MTHLSRARLAHCPYARAIVYFDRYLEKLARSDDTDLRLIRLRVPLQAVGLPGGAALDRDVVASFDPSKSVRTLTYEKSVTWRPEGGGPFPVFRGLLSIAASTPKSSMVALEGGYEPPLGVAGKAFDAVLGHRIAEATADELLSVLCDRIEREYMLDEPHVSRS